MPICIFSGRPCFTAGLTSDTALSTHSQLVYNKLVTDIGGMYSTATGKVTIGTSGIYIFHIHAHAQANDAVDLQVVHNETHVVCVFYAVISGMADPRSAAAGNTFLMHMAQGDTVTVRNKETGVASGLTGLLTPTNTMTGVLVASNADLNNGKNIS